MQVPCKEQHLIGVELTPEKSCKEICRAQQRQRGNCARYLYSACNLASMSGTAKSSTSLGVSWRDLGMSWPRRAAARASVGLSRGSAATEKDEGAGAGAGTASTGACQLAG